MTDEKSLRRRIEQLEQQLKDSKKEIQQKNIQLSGLESMIKKAKDHHGVDLKKVLARSRKRAQKTVSPS